MIRGSLTWPRRYADRPVCQRVTAPRSRSPQWAGQVTAADVDGVTVFGFTSLNSHDARLS